MIPASCKVSSLFNIFFLFIPYSYPHFPPSYTDTHSTLLDVSVMYVPLKNDSVQFSHSIMSDSLTPHGLQHARLPCPSPTPRAYSNSCHPTISPSVFPFISPLQSLPASGFLPMSQFFASGGQSIGASASASLLPMNIQDWFPLGCTSLISLRFKRTLTSLFQHHSSKASLLRPSAFFMVQLSHPYMTTRKTIALTRWTFVSKIMSLLFNMLYWFVIAFLPRSKYLLISWPWN